MAYKVRIAVRIDEDVPGYGAFHDAIYYDQPEYDALSTEQINAVIAQRVNNYKAVIDNQRIANADPAVIAEREAAEAAERHQRMQSFILTDSPELDGLLTAAVEIVKSGKGNSKTVLKNALRDAVR